MVTIIINLLGKRTKNILSSGGGVGGTSGVTGAGDTSITKEAFDFCRSHPDSLGCYVVVLSAGMPPAWEQQPAVGGTGGTTGGIGTGGVEQGTGTGSTTGSSGNSQGSSSGSSSSSGGSSP